MSELTETEKKSNDVEKDVEASNVDSELAPSRISEAEPVLGKHHVAKILALFKSLSIANLIVVCYVMYSCSRREHMWSHLKLALGTDSRTSILTKQKLSKFDFILTFDSVFGYLGCSFFSGMAIRGIYETIKFNTDPIFANVMLPNPHHFKLRYLVCFIAFLTMIIALSLGFHTYASVEMLVQIMRLEQSLQAVKAST
ncbi:hypothetical protein OXX69_010209 [Metschnikowia pulcherrima]